MGAPLCPLPQGRKGRGHERRTPPAGAFCPNDAACENQPAAVGNDRWFVSPVSGLLFTGNTATLTCRAVGARSGDLAPPAASPGILQERRSAAPVAGRAFRTRGAVTACRLKESQGPPRTAMTTQTII